MNDHFNVLIRENVINTRNVSKWQNNLSLYSEHYIIANLKTLLWNVNELVD